MRRTSSLILGRSLRILALLLLSYGGVAEAANIATSDVSTQAQVKKWHILLDMNHQPAVRSDQFSFTDFTMFFDYQLNPSHSFRVLQAPTKVYDLGGTRGLNEWQASDTILTHFWNLPVQIADTGIRMRLQNVANLPTSIDSQNNDKMVTVGQTLQVNKMFMGRFLVSVRPFYRYNWYKYKTTAGGNTLPLLQYGITMVNSYSVTDNLALNAVFAISEINESASQYDTNTNWGGLMVKHPGGRYSIDLSANYSWTDKFATYIGYSQGDNYLIDGRYEMFSYDPLVTRYSFGMTLYF